MATRTLRGRGQWGQNRPYVSPWQGGRRPAPRTSPAAPGGPATPPGPTPLPVDPLHTEQLGLNQGRLDQTLAGITYSRGQIGMEYGYNQQGQVDLSNPYSRAALLQRSFQQGQRGTTNSMAAGGQLYSGAHQRNLDEGTFRYARDEDALKRAAAQAYRDLDDREQQARFDYSQGNIDANSDRLGRQTPQNTVPPAASPRVHPTQTKDHAAAGLQRTGPNTYVGPNGTRWKRGPDGTFKRA